MQVKFTVITKSRNCDDDKCMDVSDCQRYITTSISAATPIRLLLNYLSCLKFYAMIKFLYALCGKIAGPELEYD